MLHRIDQEQPEVKVRKIDILVEGLQMIMDGLQWIVKEEGQLLMITDVLPSTINEICLEGHHNLKDIQNSAELHQRDRCHSQDIEPLNRMHTANLLTMDMMRLLNQFKMTSVDLEGV